MALSLAKNIRFIIFIICLVLAFGLYAVYAKEKNNLLLRLKQEARKKEAINSQFNSVLNSIAPLKNEVEELKGMVLSYQKKQKDIEADRKISSPVPVNTADRVLSTEKNLSRLKDYIRNTEAENNSLKEKISRLNMELESKEKELSWINKDYSSLKEDLDTALQSQDELKEEAHKNTGAIAALKTQLEQKEADFLNLNSAKLNLESQINELNNKLLILTEAKSSLEKQVAQYQQEKSSLETELGKAKGALSQHAALNDALNTRVMEAVLKLEDKEEEKAKIAKELGELSESYRAAQKEVNELKLSRANSENEINQLNFRLKETTAAYENLKGTISQLSGLLTRKELEINDKQKELASLKEAMGKADAEKNNLLAELKGKEKKFYELNAKLTYAESQIASFQSELNLARERKKRIAEQLQQTTSLNSSLQNTLTGISKDIKPVSKESALDSYYKEKADKLRKKVEVILEPQDNDVD